MIQRGRAALEWHKLYRVNLTNELKVWRDHVLNLSMVH